MVRRTINFEIELKPRSNGILSSKFNVLIIEINLFNLKVINNRCLSAILLFSRRFVQEK